MNTTPLKSVSSVAAAGVTAAAGAAQPAAVNELIANIRSEDDNLRGMAWLNAHTAGAPAVRPLADVMTDQNMEVARAAKRGLWKIVRDVGRPGADDARNAVVTELLGLLGANRPASVRREVLWMLSEIGGDESVKPLAALLSNKDLREDARMTLQRLPGTASLSALKAALAAAPSDFKPGIAQSLRCRGGNVSAIPCRKLTPTKKTTVKPVTKQAE